MDFSFAITSLLKIVGILVVILTMVSYAVYAERRVSAFIQDRLGPNRVGPAGLFQPIADMFKLLLKEDFTPRAANTFIIGSLMLAVMPASITIAVVPFGSSWREIFLQQQLEHVRDGLEQTGWSHAIRSQAVLDKRAHSSLGIHRVGNHRQNHNQYADDF